MFLWIRFRFRYTLLILRWETRSVLQLQEEEELLLQGSPLEQSDPHAKESCDTPCAAERPFIFPHTRSRPSLPPTMPTLPEEEEDSPEELDSSSSSPSTVSARSSWRVICSVWKHVMPEKLILNNLFGPSEGNISTGPLKAVIKQEGLVFLQNAAFFVATGAFT